MFIAFLRKMHPLRLIFVNLGWFNHHLIIQLEVTWYVFCGPWIASSVGETISFCVSWNMICTWLRFYSRYVFDDVYSVWLSLCMCMCKYVFVYLCIYIYYIHHVIGLNCNEQNPKSKRHSQGIINHHCPLIRALFLGQWPLDSQENSVQFWADDKSNNVV